MTLATGTLKGKPCELLKVPKHDPAQVHRGFKEKSWQQHKSFTHYLNRSAIPTGKRWKGCRRRDGLTKILATIAF
ncbi:hypothetical protein AO254_18345 [Pseudomonas syringae]|nr:hypothetical protein AO254_18345 [Pseudomonas syringae]